MDNWIMFMEDLEKNIVLYWWQMPGRMLDGGHLMVMKHHAVSAEKLVMKPACWVQKFSELCVMSLSLVINTQSPKLLRDPSLSGSRCTYRLHSKPLSGPLLPGCGSCPHHQMLTGHPCTAQPMATLLSYKTTPFSWELFHRDVSFLAPLPTSPTSCPMNLKAPLKLWSSCPF